MKRNLIFNSIIVLIGLSIFIFVFSKASVSSFTHDESYSYLHYPHAKFMDIVSFSDSYSNNHPMNTLLMKYSEKLFGNSELALRLPNLVMLLVYMLYSFLIFKRSDRLLATSMFILLCTNVLLTDLFGMARGYGMACGFMLLSLYHFMRSFDEKRTLNIILFHTGAVLAVLSHFILLTFYSSMLIVYFLMIVINLRFDKGKKEEIFKIIKSNIIPFIAAVAILYEPVRRIVKFNSFDNGGKNGFFSDSVKDLVLNTFHNIRIPQFALLSFQIVFCIIVLCYFLIIIRNIINKNDEFINKFKGLTISCLLLVFISFVIIMLHVIFNSDYPIARFSIFLFPLFIVHLGFLFDYFIKIGLKKPINSIAAALAITSVISFSTKVNTHTCGEWNYDSETKNMVYRLSKYHDDNDRMNKNTSLGINWIFEPSINYYRQTLKLDWLLPVDRSGISKNNDYFYILENDIPQLKNDDYSIIEKFDRAGTYLIRNNGKEKIITQ